ncbi:MAG TPA: LysM peptidoglycan-binding domain-containing protein [Gaiellaceae bacterium]|jgi:nucleoid-associated protein YgaU
MFVKIALIVGTAVLVWSVVARPSEAHGDRVVYRVQAYDTLWTIASSHYGGDVRDAVYRIERANHLRDSTVHPGERLVLP